MITKNTLRMALLLALVLIPSAALWAQEEAESADREESTDSAAQAPAGEAKPDEAPRAEANGCISCHLEAGGKLAEIVKEFQGSIHKEMDFSCTDCHGGDSTTTDIAKAKSVESGFIGKPDKKSIPQLCAKCHSDAKLMRQYGNIRTDQLELYKTSQHGMALFGKGDTNVATCVDCHTSHNILKVNNPKASVYKKNQPDTCGRCHSNSELMSHYGLDSEIPGLFKKSQHGVQLFDKDDLGAPVCSNCHGSHGAAPPGLATVENVCGTCHLATEKYYNNGKHAAAFSELGLGQCITCHNPHKLPKPTDNFLSEDAEPNCIACHPEGSDQYKLISGMRGTILGIQELRTKAENLVEQTEHTTHLSMYDMVPQVEQINTKMLTARAMQHATDPAAMQKNLDEATDIYKTIDAFTVRLLERARFNKMVVAGLALLLLGFGIFMFAYRRMVLDVLYPWKVYRGENDSRGPAGS